MKTTNNGNRKLIVGLILTALVVCLIGLNSNADPYDRMGWCTGIRVETNHYVLTLPLSWRNQYRTEIAVSEEVYGGRGYSRIDEDNYRVILHMREGHQDAEIATIEMYTYPEDAYELTARWDVAGTMTVADGPKDRLSTVYLVLLYPEADGTLTADEEAVRERMQGELLEAVQNLTFPQTNRYYSSSYSPVWPSWRQTTWAEQFAAEDAEARRKEREEEARTVAAPASDLRKCNDCSNLTPIGVSYCENHACLAKGGCNSWRRPNSQYCGDHTCQTTGCYDEVVQFTDHCSRHQSDRDRKELERRARNGKSSRCALCTKPAVNGSDYCTNHICIESGCKNYKVYDGLCYYHIHCKKWKSSGKVTSNRTQTTAKENSSKSSSASKNYSSNYDDYYADDPEAYYEDNKDLYGSYDEAMDDWEDEYGDDY